MQDALHPRAGRVGFAATIAAVVLIVVSVGASGAALAQAQAFPAKALRIVVPYAAGGTSDILARTLGQKLTESLGQQVIVDNKPGANGNIGADFVAKAAPDGYTLPMTDLINLIVSPAVYPKLPFDPLKDLAGVSLIAYSPHLLVVSNQTPAQSVAELVALAKSKPNGLNYATAGAGSAPQLAGALFAQRAGLAWTYVHYKGGAQAIADLASGAADVTFNGMLATYPLVRGGKLRPLAISRSRWRWSRRSWRAAFRVDPRRGDPCPTESATSVETVPPPPIYGAAIDRCPRSRFQKRVPA